MATKKTLIEKIRNKLTYLSEEDAYIAVGSVLEYIKDELSKKNRIEIRGLGSMSIREKRYTGQERKYNTIYFRMSKNVQDSLK
ncbi:MAG: HU family DNA-binding protein [Rickettsiaceae bacterium]|jgi:nucleoid DNA-binding protein|uniref:HU family DNA-binding protein n=1 Tax=Candidatus Megaera polyxenophila TaxID=988779 RepID=UPI001B487135|nr:HU family DNA-binding protein [Candidatus Megaera polyxenophila]MBP9778376.1 HU family DNA-binding protein [Rickettsiaceae bacterium]MCC8461088.1 HU family DNA-binding protein [Candidatus Megaera polyxenophila]WHA06580.1 HU family DNA-binding protein [Candidatus Megaera polyxenophila]BBB57450.1 DNA-binding protein HU-like protein [Candidatus Megaera polyxenophila]